MKWFGLLLLAAAYALLLPGLTEPMLSVSGTVEKEKLVELGREIIQESGNLPGFVADLADRLIDGMDVDGVVPAFDKTQSILGTARDLYANGDAPVAVLIVLFSVIVPAFKALVLALALCPLAPRRRRRFALLADASGKWSMADVFVIAIFIAYLAAGGIRGGSGLVEFESELGRGFWFFLGYCLVSLLGTQLLVRALRRESVTALANGPNGPNGGNRVAGDEASAIGNGDAARRADAGGERRGTAPTEDRSEGEEADRSVARGGERNADRSDDRRSESRDERRNGGTDDDGSGE